MARRNRYGKDMDLQNEATARYRDRQREQRDWLKEVSTHLGVEPHELLKISAATVAALIRTQGTQ